MAISSRLTVDVGQRGTAERLCKALLPEIRSNKSKAATISLEAHGGSVVILIESSTIAATRALLNSYIRWISISLDIVNMKGE